MTELRKCSRCRSEIELKYFAINRKGEHNKTCETCLNKSRAYHQTTEAIDRRQQRNGISITCNNCGETHTKNTISKHKRQYWCKTSHVSEKPNFEEWLTEQDYDTLLWEYKQLLKEILERKKCNDTATTE